MINYTTLGKNKNGFKIQKKKAFSWISPTKSQHRNEREDLTNQTSLGDNMQSSTCSPWRLSKTLHYSFKNFVFNFFFLENISRLLKLGKRNLVDGTLIYELRHKPPIDFTRHLDVIFLLEIYEIWWPVLTVYRWVLFFLQNYLDSCVTNRDSTSHLFMSPPLCYC